MEMFIKMKMKMKVKDRKKKKRKKGKQEERTLKDDEHYGFRHEVKLGYQYIPNCTLRSS